MVFMPLFASLAAEDGFSAESESRLNELNALMSGSEVAT